MSRSCRAHDNPNGARVKMMRPRRVYVGADLERLFADYLTHLACRADELGFALSSGFAAAGEPEPSRRCWRRCGRGRSGTRPRRCAARASARRGGPRTGFATATPPRCCWPGPRSGWCHDGWVMRTCRPRWTSTAGSARTRRCAPRRTGSPIASGWQVPDEQLTGHDTFAPAEELDPARAALARTCPRRGAGRSSARASRAGADATTRERERMLAWTGLPDPFPAELAWMAHWQAGDGTRIVGAGGQPAGQHPAPGIARARSPVPGLVARAGLGHG